MGLHAIYALPLQNVVLVVLFVLFTGNLFFSNRSVAEMFSFISMCVSIKLDPGAHFLVYLNLELGALWCVCASVRLNVEAWIFIH